jgi:hypothetical protein
MTILTRNRCSTPCRRSLPERFVSTGLPQPAVRRQGGGMRVGSGILDWYNHRHRHSGIKFVTPHQRHSGADLAICRVRRGLKKLAKPTQKRWS